MKKKIIYIFLLIFLFAGSSCLFAEANTYKITDKAELKKISIFQEKVRSKSSEKLVVFEITLKNVSSEAQRYSLICIVDGESAGEGFLPYAEEKVVVPGEEVTDSVAVLTPDFPSSFELIIDLVE